jgi:hypothetical protein
LHHQHMADDEFGVVEATRQHTLRDWHTGTKPASPLFSRREDRQGTLRMCMPGRQCGCGQRHLNLLTDPDVGEVSCGR